MSFIDYLSNPHDMKSLATYQSTFECIEKFEDDVFQYERELCEPLIAFYNFGYYDNTIHLILERLYLVYSDCVINGKCSFKHLLKNSEYLFLTKLLYNMGIRDTLIIYFCDYVSKQVKGE